MAGERPHDDLPGYPPPLSELPWSADFVMQGIEILPVTLRDEVIVFLKPEHAESYIVGWPPGAKPEDVASEALRRIGLDPIVLHSTSRRDAGNEAVLTYIAVTTPRDPAEVLVEVPVERAAVARGDAMAPPPVIGVAQVLEHALRHLAWLVQDDPAIASVIGAWKTALAGYVPEPFRSFRPDT